MINDQWLMFHVEHVSEKRKWKVKNNKWKVKKMILNIQILMILISDEYLYQNEKKMEIWHISEREKISKIKLKTQNLKLKTQELWK